MSAATMQPASSTFDMIDRNHDGVITQSEFSRAVMMPTMTYAGAASGVMAQQAVTMQPQPVMYSAPQQPIAYEQAFAPGMFSGQPQLIYSTAQPANIVYEQAAPAIAYAEAPATQVAYQQAPAVTYAAPAASQVVSPAGYQVVHEQSVPAVTYATAPTSQVTYEQTSPSVTYEAAPAAQATYEQTAPAVTYAAAPAPVAVPTLMNYTAYTAPQATAQVSYPLAVVTATEQPMQYTGPSVQLATEQIITAAGSVSMAAPQPYMVESAVVAGYPPSILTYAPMLQPQAAYYQGGMQAAAVQPQVTYGSTTAGMQTMMFEQQMAAQPCMAMTMPHMQQVPGGEQMMTIPAGATMEQSVAVPQQTEVVAAPVMEQPAVVSSKKAKKKLTSKKKEKACC